MAMNMSFQRQYAERYDWLAALFKDWAFRLLTSFFYYEDNASLKDEAKKALQPSFSFSEEIFKKYLAQIMKD